MFIATTLSALNITAICYNLHKRAAILAACAVVDNGGGAWFVNPASQTDLFVDGASIRKTIVPVRACQSTQHCGCISDMVKY